jgi:hypothetical protein
MRYPFGLRGLRLAVAGAAACASFALTNVARAHASDLATCTFQTHVTLSGANFSSDGGGGANCTGIIDGALPAPNGAFDAQGAYSGSSCSSGSWHGSFDAEIPRVLSFFDSQNTQFLGSVQIAQAGHMLMVSGSGVIDGHTVGYGGTGSFVPDSGQACSGTLTESVVLMDAGGPATGSQATTQSRGARHHRHHRHHRRPHRRAK